MGKDLRNVHVGGWGSGVCVCYIFRSTDFDDSMDLLKRTISGIIESTVHLKTHKDNSVLQTRKLIMY